ncbi:MAG: TonB-dependent receptor [Nannocystaceae bacterium]|nr:TonB-dependent receptor [Myxococcales bacterium]
MQTAEAGPSDAVLTGVVRNPSTNEAIEGAVVVVTGEHLIQERSMSTDSNGVYRIPNLPPGEYEITVLHPSGATARREGLKLRAGNTHRVDFAMTPEAFDTETIVVPAPPVDVTSSSTGLAIDSEMAQRVPIAQPTGKGGANRSFEAIAEATPGANGDTYGTSIAGTTSPENKYYVDGLSVNDPGFGLNGTALSVEFLKEVRVEAGGYMPEYGRATGGIVNAVTKTGSNKFHGGVWGFFTPGALEGTRKQPQREGSTIQIERNLLWLGDIGFDVGGRIIKDKLWFYGGVSLSRTVYDITQTWNRVVVDPTTGEAVMDDETGFTKTERIPGTTDIRRAQATTIQALAKLTYAPVKNHTLELMGIYAPTLSGGNGSYGLDARTGQPELVTAAGTYDALAHKYRDDAADVQLKWNVLADNNRWDVTTILGWHHQVNQRLPSDGSSVGSNEGLAAVPWVVYRRNNPELHSITDFTPLPGAAPNGACDPFIRPGSTAEAEVRTVTCPVTTYYTGGPGFIFDRRLNRLQARSMATRLAQGAGHHVIKFGVDFEYMQYNSHRGYTGNTAYRESTSGATYSDYREYGFLTGPDQALILPSLQWSVFSTTIGGFLQDSWSIMDKVTLNVGLRYDAQHLFGGDGNLAMSLPNQISPRVGLIWDPTQRGKSKLFANYARFYQSVPLNLADRAGSGEPSFVSVHDASVCDPANLDDHLGACQTDGSRVQLGGPSDPDQLWIVTGAGKTPIDPKLKPQSSDEIVAGGEYELIPDGRLGVSYTHRWLNRVIEDMSRDEATTYFIGNPGYGIATDFPKAQRIYDAAVLYFDKRFSRGWLVSASYTLAFLRGNIAGLFRPETGQLDPNINSDFDLISLLDNRFGYLPGDSRHTFKVFAGGEIDVGRGNAILVGGAFRAQSGSPTNVLGSHMIYGSDEVFILPRGAGVRLPWVFRLDTNIGFRRYFSKDLAIAITMDVFNVANFQAATLIDETYTLQDVLPLADGTTEDLKSLKDIDGETVVVNPNFGRPKAFQTPRQFRFGVRFQF